MNESTLPKELLDTIPSQSLPKIQSILSMVSLGATPKMVATYMGITLKEYDALEASHPALFKAIWSARTSSALQVTANLYRLATKSDDVGAIKAMLGIFSDEFKDKSSTAASSITQNNNYLTLPSTKEALAFIQSDPSIIEAESETSI